MLVSKDKLNFVRGCNKKIMKFSLGLQSKRYSDRFSPKAECSLKASHDAKSIAATVVTGLANACDGLPTRFPHLVYQIGVELTELRYNTRGTFVDEFTFYDQNEFVSAVISG